MNTRSILARTAHALRPWIASPHCGECSGFGFLYTQGEAKRNCPACDGTGLSASVTRLALEVSRNAFGPVQCGDDPIDTLTELIAHRVRHGWLMCPEIAIAARAGAAALKEARPASPK